MKSGWPANVTQSLKNRVRNIINNERVYEFYVGRTTDITSTGSRHGCDVIIPVYSTSSADHAIQVEGALIRTFHRHPQCSNDSPHSGGGVADGYMNYVYVAVWKRTSPM